jgi:hypothetical protein
LLLLLSRPTQVLELLDKAEDEPLLALFFLQRLIEQQYVEEVAPPQAASSPLVLPVAAKDIPSPPEDPPSSTSIDSWSAGPYSFTQELDLALVGPDAADDDALDGTVRIQALPVQPTGQDPTTEITLEDLSSALPEDAASTDPAETADAEQATIAEGSQESQRDLTTSDDTQDGAPTGGLDSENDRVASYDSPPIGPSEEARARLQVTTPVDDDKNTLLHSAMQDRSLPFQRPADPNAGVFFSAHSVLDVVDLRHITQFSVATDIPLDGIVEAAGAEDDESHFAGADDGSSDEHDEHDADEHDASEEEADSEASEPEEEAPVHTDDELQLTHGDTGFDPELAAALLRAAAQAETELRRPLPPGTSPSSTDLHDLGFSRLLGESDAEVEEVEDLRPENVVSRPSAAPTVLLRRTELQRMAQEHSNLSIVDEDEPEDLDDVLQLGATVVIPRDEANALLAKDPGSSPASPSGQAPSNPTESAAGRPAGSSQDDEMSQSERDILRSISDIFPQNEAGTGHERKARRNQTGEQPTAYLSRSMNHALKATLRHRTDIYNRIFSVIFSHFQARLGREQAITRFQAFFNHRDRSYPELFIDLAFRADGTLDQELLLKNLEVYPTPRPAEVLDASLNEVFYFLLRDIHLLLNPEEQSEMMDAVVQVRNLLYKRTSQP